jgi:sporulation protein YlmC with PRC-barrel domain
VRFVKPIKRRRAPERRAPDAAREPASPPTGIDRLAAEAYLRSTHGFLVDTVGGREVGVVEDVLVDGETGIVQGLRVVGGWFGRRETLVDVNEVEEIFPAIRRLTIRPDETAQAG